MLPAMDERGLLEREESLPISLTKGLDEVIRQHEYDPQKDRKDRFIIDKEEDRRPGRQKDGGISVAG